MAGIATAIVVLFAGLGALAEESSIAVFRVLFSVFLVQAVVALTIAVGVGLTNLLRNADVVLEAPPPPKPKPVAQPQAYSQPYAQQPAQAPPGQAPPPAQTAPPAQEQPAGQAEQAAPQEPPLDWPDKPSE